MAHRILIPADGQPRDHVPRGAALLEVRGGRALVGADLQSGFADRCQAATRGAGRLVVIDFETHYVGSYDDTDGELRLDPRGGAERLRAWYGRPLYRNDLEARDSRTSRRSRARSLTLQGRHAEAYRIDRRMGL